MPSDFRTYHLPYCLEKLADGKYVVLNRKYKPIGFYTTKQVDYESYPVAVKLKLAPKTIQKLSWNGSDDPVKIYLYDDGCIPTDSTKHMTAYLDKIALLAKVKVG